EDLYPRIQAAIERPEVYAQEPVRIEMMKHFGYFVTESSGHASEYLPYFRKTAQMVNQDLVPRFTDHVNHWFDFGRTGGYLRHCISRLDKAQHEFDELIAGTRQLPTTRSHEYGSAIMEAIETNRPTRINGNVPNRDLMANLPPGCCVEVPCLVDGSGIQPTRVDAYPPQPAGPKRSINKFPELVGRDPAAAT